MTREEVLTLLPEIKLIHSTDLQEKSITCWQQVLELGGWDKKGVDKAPLAAGIVADDCPETGIDHCRRVVRMCQLAYDELGGWANEISKLDHDTLICGAVLNDIGPEVGAAGVPGAVGEDGAAAGEEVAAGDAGARADGVGRRVVVEDLLHELGGLDEGLVGEGLVPDIGTAVRHREPGKPDHAGPGVGVARHLAGRIHPRGLHLVHRRPEFVHRP